MIPLDAVHSSLTASGIKPKPAQRRAVTKSPNWSGFIWRLPTFSKIFRICSLDQNYITLRSRHARHSIIVIVVTSSFLFKLAKRAQLVLDNMVRNRAINTGVGRRPLPALGKSCPQLDGDQHSPTDCLQGHLFRVTNCWSHLRRSQLVGIGHPTHCIVHENRSAILTSVTWKNSLTWKSKLQLLTAAQRRTNFVYLVLPFDAGLGRTVRVRAILTVPDTGMTSSTAGFSSPHPMSFGVTTTHPHHPHHDTTTTITTESRPQFHLRYIAHACAL